MVSLLCRITFWFGKLIVFHCVLHTINHLNTISTWIDSTSVFFDSGYTYIFSVSLARLYNNGWLCIIPVWCFFSLLLFNWNWSKKKRWILGIQNATVIETTDSMGWPHRNNAFFIMIVEINIFAMLMTQRYFLENTQQKTDRFL